MDAKLCNKIVTNKFLTKKFVTNNVVTFGAPLSVVYPAGNASSG